MKIYVIKKAYIYNTFIYFYSYVYKQSSVWFDLSTNFQMGNDRHNQFYSIIKNEKEKKKKVIYIWFRLF